MSARRHQPNNYAGIVVNGILSIWRRFLRRPASDLALLSFLILLLPASGTAQVEKGGTDANLVLHGPRLFRIPAAGSISVGLDAAEGRHAEILIETSAPGVDFVVLTPDGQQLQAASAEYPGWLTISFPFSVRGNYRLVARAKPSPDYVHGVVFHAVLLDFSPNEAVTHSKAEALFASAQTFSRAPKALGLREAIHAYRQAGAAWAAAGEREGQVLSLTGEAQAWLGLSEHDKATAALNRAAVIAPRMPYWQTLLANLQAQVFLDRWEIRPSKKTAEEALRMSRGLEDDWLTSDALANRGEAEYLTHDPDAPVDIAEALRLAREIGAVSTIARALRCEAWMEKDEGHLSRAFALLDTARDYFHSGGEIRPELQAMATLAQIENTSGEIYTTLLWHSKLASLMSDTGYAAHYAVLLDDIGRDYEGLNRVPDAIVYFQQALAVYKTIHDASGTAAELLSLSSAELEEKHLPESLRDCQEATAIVEQFHDPWRSGNANWRLGTVQQALGQTALAMNSFRRATELSRSAQNMIGEAHALVDWGDTLESLGTPEKARELYEQALTLSETAGAKPLQLEARYRIAHSEFESGRDEDAKRNLRLALDSIESLRRTVGDADLQASAFAQMRKCYQLYVDILMREHERDRASPSDMLALEISESARARTLLDLLKARDLDQPPNQSEDPSAERIKLRIAVEQAYDQRLKLMLEGGRKRELQENSATLTQAIDSLQRMEDVERDDAKAIPPSGRPLSAQDILQASKSSSATLLEFALGAEQSYLWVVHDGTINSYVLKARQEEIEGLVGRWRKLGTTQIPREGDDAERELQGVAAKLSCLLLNDYIGPEDKKLAIVADGELATLPFASLPLNGCDAKPGPPVITAHQVVMIPSLSIFLTHPVRDARTRFSKEVAIVANPVFDPGDARVHIKPSDMRRGWQSIKDAPALPRLAGTGEEALEIQQTVGPERASVFLGFNASVETILSPEMRNYRVLHLATHGIADESTPGFSGLVLSLVSPDGHPVFGYLKTHDIGNLDLHPDLVVLSACDSGAGSNLSGEGVTGLAYAFLNAGARQVASTLWDVDDEVTKDLMINFYKEMYRAGLDPADALRQSQILMMQSPHRSAPYYWAGFEITSIGN
jgi:CHAT domain-containing protein